jgi:hypothetical protein
MRASGIARAGNDMRTMARTEAIRHRGGVSHASASKKELAMNTTKVELHRLVEGLLDHLLGGDADRRLVPVGQTISVLRDLSRIMAILTRMAKDLASRQAPLNDPGEGSLDVFRS